MAKANYSADSIIILKDLEAVRKRPEMYIGSTNYLGMHHLVWEILDNAIDEVLAGYCSEIEVTWTKPNQITIFDNGRGIPTSQHKTGRPTPEVIFTVLHAGGKFNNDNYQHAGGLHGVGASVVNALSQQLQITIYRHHKEFTMRFHQGGQIEQPFKQIGATKKQGTKITFTPDPLIFDTQSFQKHLLTERLQELAFLNPNLKISFHDLVHQTKTVFQYQKGIQAYLAYLNEHKKPIANLIHYRNEANHFEMAMQYVATDQENIISFANNIKTIQGGTHCCWWFLSWISESFVKICAK